MGESTKTINKQGKRLSKTISDFLSTFGLVSGKLLRLKSKTFFAISPPNFDSPDFPINKINFENKTERPTWKATGNTKNKIYPKTCYMKKNDIVMYLGTDVLYYGDEAYACVNVFYDEKIYSLYIISFEDIQDSKNIIFSSWEVLF